LGVLLGFRLCVAILGYLFDVGRAPEEHVSELGGGVQPSGHFEAHKIHRA